MAGRRKAKVGGEGAAARRAAHYQFNYDKVLYCRSICFRKRLSGWNAHLHRRWTASGNEEEKEADEGKKKTPKKRRKKRCKETTADKKATLANGRRAGRQLQWVSALLSLVKEPCTPYCEWIGLFRGNRSKEKLYTTGPGTKRPTTPRASGLSGRATTTSPERESSCASRVAARPS